MLIVSNGAFKSGSTWLTLVARQLVDYVEVPAEFDNKLWKSDTVKPARMATFLQTTDIEASNYIIKAHYKPEDGMRPLLVGKPHIKVLNIYRDPKDVVVSAYYHFRRIGQYDCSIGEFFEQRAENLVRALTRYHLYWDNHGAEDSVFFTTYQKLHTQFDDEIFRLGRFLGLPLTMADVARAREETKFSQLSPTTVPEEKRFFRKGVMGDWQRHLTLEQAARVDEVEAEEGIYLIRDEILY